MREMRKIFILMVVVFGFGILFSSEGYADNWVCYAYDDVTEDELRDNFPSQTGSPLDIVDAISESEVKSRTAFIRSCESPAGETFQHCPEDEYYRVETFEVEQRCLSFSGAHTRYEHYVDGEKVADCGLGGSPSCDDWSDEDVVADGESTGDIDFYCGEDDDLWETVSAQEWLCPTCKELAMRVDSPPVLDLSSFSSLSFRDFPIFSDSNNDITFMAFVEACINRIPIMNLKLDLLTDEEESLSSGVGIYARHDTLDYNNDNMGLYRDFNVPHQENFMETYTLKGNLRAYRAWAWRERLIVGMERMVDSKGLDVPGFPSTNEPQTIGDLYYSEDFLAGMGDLTEEADTECSARITASRDYTINVLTSVPQLDGEDMCKSDDLNNYMGTHGMTDSLEEVLKEQFNIGEEVDVLSASFSPGNNDVVEFNTEVEIDINDYEDFNSTSDALDKIENGEVVHDELYEKIKDSGDLSKDTLRNDAKDSRPDIFDVDFEGCNNYEFSLTSFDLDGDFSQLEETGPDTISLNVPIKTNWVNDIAGRLSLDVETDHDCDATWDWMGFGEVEPEVLAKCLYNWDECLMNPRDDENDHELAACGMGPPSELMDTTLKDAARGNKVLEPQITTYRRCEDDDYWVSGENMFACREGDTYRCKFEPSLDTVNFVEKANVGETINISDDWYVCLNDGTWNPICR